VLAPYFGSSIYVGNIITVHAVAAWLSPWRATVDTQPSLSRFATLFVVGALLTYLSCCGEALMRLIFDHRGRYGSLVAAAALFMLPTVVLGIISPIRSGCS
jgi:hypothetical protein